MLTHAMQDAGFYIFCGPNHYHDAWEDPAIKVQRDNNMDLVRHNRRMGRTMQYSNETSAKKNMSAYSSWNDGTTNSCCKVP